MRGYVPQLITIWVDNRIAKTEIGFDVNRQLKKILDRIGRVNVDLDSIQLHYMQERMYLFLIRVHPDTDLEKLFKEN